MRFYSCDCRCRKAWLVGFFSLAMMAGCSGAAVETTEEELASQSIINNTAETQTADPGAPVTAEPNDRNLTIPETATPRSPSLIKKASLRLELADIDEAIVAVSDILAQYQGDLLQLSDEEGERHTPRQVGLQVRVPEDNLEATLEALRGLGTVVSQTITAEDVTTQLVDLQARIRNLRKSEASLLEIMERSGSIADVLAVTQELSTVREAIERNDAQLKNLHNRVAYSTISLTLTSPQQSAPLATSTSTSLRQTWQTATATVRGFSVGLLRLLLWLLAFSPYIGVLVLVGWSGRRYWANRPKTDEPISPH